MKKFFFSACALIALVACNKEQTPAYNTFTIVEGSFEVPATGGEVTVIYKTNLEVISTPDTTWVTVKEINQESTVLSVKPYNGFVRRLAAIQFSTPKGGLLKQAYITQKGVPVTVTDKIEFAKVAGDDPKTDRKTFPSEGGTATFTLNVTGADGYEVVIPDKDPWYTLTGTTLSAKANPTDAKRTGTINIIAPKTADDTTRSVLKAVKFEQDGALLRYKRLIGWYSEGDDIWTKNFSGVALTHPDGYGMARAVAMDDENVYLPKMTAWSAIGTIKLSDLSQGAANVSGISGGNIGGSNYSLCFARTMSNSDASVNGGKDILVVANVTETNSDANQLRLYAYKDGTSAAPTQIAGYCYDATTSANDPRRYGDRFAIDGTWDKATVYFPAFEAGKVLALSVEKGARTNVRHLITPTASDSPAGIKDITVCPDGSSLLLSNASFANILGESASLGSLPLSEYALRNALPEAIGIYGINFFTFRDKKYIAYVKVQEEQAWYEIIEDPGDPALFADALSKPTVLYKYSLHDRGPDPEEDSTEYAFAKHATGGIADCAVRVLEDRFYIAALTRDGGFVLDEIAFK